MTLLQINFTCSGQSPFEYLPIVLTCLISPFVIWLIYNLVYRLYNKIINMIEKKKKYILKIEQLLAPQDISVRDLNLKSYGELLCNICSKQIQDIVHITQNYQMYHKYCYENKELYQQEEIKVKQEQLEQKVKKQDFSSSQSSQETTKQLRVIIQEQQSQLQPEKALNDQQNSQQNSKDDDIYDGGDQEDEDQQKRNQIKCMDMKNNIFIN
ncbi:hypothetical protein ABPG72_018007 [Tetrahymena utriculariae]